MRELTDFTLEETIQAMKELKATDGWRILEGRLKERAERGRHDLVIRAQTHELDELPAFAAHIDAAERFRGFPDDLIAVCEMKITQKNEEAESARFNADDFTAL